MDKNYLESLKSPEWQKKRLEIFERDNFTCQFCGSKDKLLHVHHKLYEKGKMLWEYDNKDLVTICCTCHEYVTYDKKTMYDAFIEARDSMRKFGFSDAVFSSILSNFSSFFEKIENGEELDYLEVVRDLINRGVFGTQNYDDFKTLTKLGYNYQDYVNSVYPIFKDEYGKLVESLKK